jgi:putative DNA primase/helicase
MARPVIDVTGGDLHVHADEAWDALAKAIDPALPEIVVRGNDLSRMTERRALEPVTTDALRDLLSRVAQFEKRTQGGTVSVKPPADVAKVLLARDSADYVGAPRVDRVVDTPVLGPDGTLIDRPGYHEAARLLYVPDPSVEDARAGSVDTVDDVVAARDLLMDELLGDFGFADEASKANALGLLLLPFVREYIGDFPTPLHLIVAPEVGTGKTLLAQAALLPGCGVVALTAETRNEEEMRKRITAQLLNGTRAVVFDNIAGAITSSVLAGALTSGTWTDRKLGESREVVMPIRNVWVATGNNLELTDEHTRRAVPIVLDPGDVRPSERPKDAYRHADLQAWARANRSALASAALTLIRHWLEGDALADVTGRFERIRVLTDSTQTLGSYERWGTVIGGILAAADVPGFLENRNQLGASNTDREDAAAFLAVWRGLGLAPQSLDEVTTLCRFGGPLRDYVPDDVRAESEEAMRKKMSYWLRGHKGAKYGGLKLVALDGRPRRWEITDQRTAP